MKMAVDTPIRTPHDRLKYMRCRRGYATPAAFAHKFADRGVREGTYGKHERGERGIGRMVELYADLLDTFPEWLQYGIGPEDRVENQPERRNAIDNVRFLGNLKGLPPNSGGNQDRFNKQARPPGVPVHASVPGPGKGWLMLSSPSHYVEALAELSGVENPRAYTMPSDEMDPVIVSGEVLYPHPDKQPKNRSIVMIRLKEYPDEWIARELIARDQTHITVRKYGIKTEPTDTVLDWDQEVQEMTVVLRER